MDEILDEEEVTWDMIQYWAQGLDVTATKILENRYEERFDHGPPVWPPVINDKDWYFEEYEDAVRMSCPVKTFTVVGYWDGEQQRFCTSVKARTPLQAERAVLEDYEDADLCVVATFPGEITPEDFYYARHVSSTSNPPAIE